MFVWTSEDRKLTTNQLSEFSVSREERVNMAEEDSRKEATSSSGYNFGNYVSKIIATINPELYAEFTTSRDKKAFLKLREKDFWKAVAKATAKPAEEHKIIYDSTSETLEPLYFWIIDKMADFFRGNVEKLVDNFSSSPGGGHFSELMAKGTKMQEEAMKIMQTTGVLVKSLINIIYDLKEFEIRLSQYKAAGSKNKDEAEAGLLALKQIWMDNVDVKRGRASINMLAQDLSFVTIRDAFMMAKSVEDIDLMDLNDRVKRILKPRVQEFFKWRELSESELKKRYSIERTYLKSQLNSLKLYTRWAKPYLRAASQLEQKEYGRNPALVTAFNTIILELAVVGKNEQKLQELVFAKQLPDAFRNKEMKRKYYSCVFVDFGFRGIPQRVGQNYVFGGRAEVNFRAFSLNNQEWDFLNEKLKDSDMQDALKLVEGMTDDSIKELQADLDYFLKEEDERRKLDNAQTVSDDTNPFSALFGMAESKSGKEEGKKDGKEDEKIDLKKIKPDTFVEKLLRAQAEAIARKNCFDVYDIFKKSRGMASHPEPGFEPRNVGYPGDKFFKALGL